MKQVLIKGGRIDVSEVPPPCAGRGMILVRTEYSCVSPGTELAGLRSSAEPLYKRAWRQPDKVMQVLRMALDRGVADTADRVSSQLGSAIPIGYSACGIVLEVGAEVNGFIPGDRVACAGAGYANHAEIIAVPVNLAVKLPAGLDPMTASSVTLGAIALQSLRRASPQIGEIFLVVGLGLLGQLVAQLLKRNGITVIGADPDRERADLALRRGMDHAIDAAAPDFPDAVLRLTGGFGADGAIVSAASRSDAPVNEAIKACRKKGRVVILGDVGMRLERAELYRKELDLLISTSYGPGRHDPEYEEKGNDYPLPYVRWTENRNMEAYLGLLASGAISLEGFHGDPVDVDGAEDAYARLASGADRCLMTFIRYPGRHEARQSTIVLRSPAVERGRVRVGLIGTGSFASTVHLPNLARLRDRYEIRGICGATGAKARTVAERFAAAFVTSRHRDILEDPEIDLVIIATRHDTHACLALEALQAGKAVFVEKPLAIRTEELDELESHIRRSPRPALLLTGFNRRFSPALSRIAEALSRRSTPLIVNYRMNAGFIPPEHWVHGDQGGGRNIGEACHIYDLFNFLTGSRWRGVDAAAAAPASRQWHSNENFVATVSYEDGSVCTLTYAAQGASGYPKERMEIFFDGKVISLDDYRSAALVSDGRERRLWSAASADKGHFAELEALAECLKRGAASPISLEHQIAATRISFAVEDRIRTRGPGMADGRAPHRPDEPGP
ncbi:MAG TPA: bi-domain-containing oxidoreductase, partial [Burkholderiales bacterium]|nr:bi-domain-containing oxidoreductase [Burkholderiales bacterium]